MLSSTPRPTAPSRRRFAKRPVEPTPRRYRTNCATPPVLTLARTARAMRAAFVSALSPSALFQVPSKQITNRFISILVPGAKIYSPNGLPEWSVFPEYSVRGPCIRRGSAGDRRELPPPLPFRLGQGGHRRSRP